MTDDEIIELAREAGFESNSLGVTYTSGCLPDLLERFAALVADAERERCVRVVETKRCLGCLHQFQQPEQEVSAYSLLAQAMESLGERLLDDTFGYEWKEGVKAVLAQGEPTYCTGQHTKCAVCLEDKHTPLRIDSMGGYVCLTCIDRKLTGLLQVERPA